MFSTMINQYSLQGEKFDNKMEGYFVKWIEFWCYDLFITFIYKRDGHLARDTRRQYGRREKGSSQIRKRNEDLGIRSRR